MDLKKYKEEAIVLLGEYHKREAQIRLLEVEYQAMEQLTPGVSAVSYDQVNAHTNKIVSPVEGAVQRAEKLQDDLDRIRKRIVWLKLQNQKIDVVLSAMTEPYRSLIQLRYIDMKPWKLVCPRCAGYSEEYVRKELSEKALLMFISLYYPETNMIGLFAYMDSRINN